MRSAMLREAATICPTAMSLQGTPNRPFPDVCAQTHVRHGNYGMCHNWEQGEMGNAKVEVKRRRWVSSKRRGNKALHRAPPTNLVR